MTTYLKTTFAGLALLASVSAAGAQDMATRLSPPATVSLDFLGWIDRDTDWLMAELARDGVQAGVSLSGDGQAAEVATLDALGRVNRIRAFAHLAQPGLRSPYIDLRLAAPGDQPQRCITQFASSIVPQISAMDFARTDFTTDGADPAVLDQCLVPQGTSEFAGLGRDALRDRYFDKSGVLRSEFAPLANDPAFLAALIDQGFLVSQEDYSGLPRLDAE